MTLTQQCTIALPAWIGPLLESREFDYATDEGRMAFVIALARQNVRAVTGGPFAAAVFGTGDSGPVSVGVNLVTSSGLSLAHAEMVALSLAQQALDDWDLARHGELCLVSSCEPCAMCFGAVPWSGVRSLLCGARKADAEAAGFDEGDKPAEWAQSLRDRGIAVTEGLLQDEAASVFDYYRERGGEIYNSGGGAGSED